MLDKVYKQLWRLNRAFKGVAQSLGILATHDPFDQREIGRYRALIEEAQAATNSYLAHAIDAAESSEAGRLFRHRIARERREEKGRH